MAQMARFRQPGAAAIAFMNTLAPTEARFSARARSARRPCSARAMPRQAKTRAAASGMSGLEGGDHGEVAGGFDHPVLGGEAHRRGGRGQHAQPGGGVAQPQAGAVLAGTGPSGPGDFAGDGALRGGRPGRAGQHKRNAGHHGTAAGVMANHNERCRAHGFCHGMTAREAVPGNCGRDFEH